MHKAVQLIKIQFMISATNDYENTIIEKKTTIAPHSAICPIQRCALLMFLKAC